MRFILLGFILFSSLVVAEDTFYEYLGVPEGASVEDIEAARKKMIGELPMLFPTQDDFAKEAEIEKVAYVLSHKHLRQVYDKHLKTLRKNSLDRTLAQQMHFVSRIESFAREKADGRTPEAKHIEAAYNQTVAGRVTPDIPRSASRVPSLFSFIGVDEDATTEQIKRRIEEWNLRLHSGIFLSSEDFAKMKRKNRSFQLAADLLLDEDMRTTYRLHLERMRKRKESLSAKEEIELFRKVRQEGKRISKGPKAVAQNFVDAYNAIRPKREKPTQKSTSKPRQPFRSDVIPVQEQTPLQKIAADASSSDDEPLIPFKDDEVQPKPVGDNSPANLKKKRCGFAHLAKRGLAIAGVGGVALTISGDSRNRDKEQPIDTNEKVDEESKAKEEKESEKTKSITETLEEKPKDGETFKKFRDLLNKN